MFGKKLPIKAILAAISILGLFFIIVPKVLADEVFDASSTYDQAVKNQIIDPNIYPKDVWESDEVKYMKPSYEQFKNELSETTSYQEWLEMNNYGVMKDSKEPLLHGKTESLGLHSEQDNINAFCRATRAGDILVIYGNTQHGIPSMLGHAAILNSDWSVLEMPGGGRDNNRQWNKRDWITAHIKEWTAVYRVSNNNLARQVAHYADTHFYSTTGGYTKNIHIDYGIDPRIKRINPNYCSKLVWQAYYYGSGSLPVVRETGDFGFIAPASLFSSFSANYTPRYLGKY